MSQPSDAMRPPHRRGAFTLIDLMITLVILAILAAVALPLVGDYVEQSDQTAAQTTFEQVRKAVDLHYTKHGSWPSEISPGMFENHEAPTLPDGYTLDYDPLTGALALVEPTP